MVKRLNLIYQKQLVCVYLFSSPSAHSFWSVSQLEIDDGDELTSDFLYEEVHPKQHAHKQAFAKPKGPAKKGGRRITRPPAEREEED